MNSFKYFKQLLTRFGLLLILSSTVRLLYYFYNKNFFPQPAFNDWVGIFFGGLRFDIESLIYVNALFIIFSVLPVPFKDKKWYRRLLLVLFILFNLVYFSIEISDLVYFQYVFRRINGSDLSILLNSIELLPTLMFEHFEGIIFFVLLTVFLWLIFKKTENIKAKSINYLYASLVFVFTLGLAVIGSRGGLQLRPLSPISASRYVTKKQLIPLVSNGTIHLLFATEQKYLSKKNYFDKKKAYSIFSPVRKGDASKQMNKKNIFFITLESFGKEYIHYFNKDLDKSYTPFLDSLIGESFNFEDAYACGTRSPYGIAGIGAGIPTLMQEPISFSAYQSNCIDGIGSLLNETGYTTAFFHGARPSSMNIDRLGRLEGFTKIFTKDDFNDDTKFDGDWGIWDNHFFQYTVDQISKFKEPFCSFLFSISSHSPYVVEKYFEEKYPDDDPILRTVRYTDYSLRNLFEKAKKQSWYNNTIFVITADHIGRAFDKKFTNPYTKYQIPLIIYTPDSTYQGKYSNVVNQTDIMPTLLQYLGYPKDYNVFGFDVFNPENPRYAYTYSNGIYQILDKDNILFFDGDVSKGFYNYKTDPQLNKDLSNEEIEKKKKMETYMKALIQIHNELMIDNKICNYNFNNNK